jgi:hypothetical protein
MKTSSMLVALVVVLGFCRDARAISMPAIEPEHDYTVNILGHSFGFLDYESGIAFAPVVYCGPFGDHAVPFTATQGLIGFCVVFVTLIFVPVVLTVRWKKRAANQG